MSDETTPAIEPVVPTTAEETPTETTPAVEPVVPTTPEETPTHETETTPAE